MKTIFSKIKELKNAIDNINEDLSVVKKQITDTKDRLNLECANNTDNYARVSKQINNLSKFNPSQVPIDENQSITIDIPEIAIRKTLVDMISHNIRYNKYYINKIYENDNGIVAEIRFVERCNNIYSNYTKVWFPYNKLINCKVITTQGIYALSNITVDNDNAFSVYFDKLDNNQIDE